MTEPCFCGSRSSVPVRDTIRGDKQRPIIKCRDCEAVRKGNLREQSHRELHERGEQAAEIDLDSLSDSYRNRNLTDVERRIDAVRPHLDGSETLLDFGTGMGHFMDQVDPYVGQVVGTEINEKRLAFLREELGYPVYEGTEDLRTDFEDGEFDIITMFHVLEHLPNPVEHLQSVRRLLKPDGLLFIEVPNHDDWLLSMSDAYSDFYYQDAHAYYFTPSSLKLVLEKAGFSAQVSGVQRYSIRNSFHWIRHGEPELESPSRFTDSWDDPLDKVYGAVLKATLRSDTLWAVVRPTDQGSDRKANGPASSS